MSSPVCPRCTVSLYIGIITILPKEHVCGALWVQVRAAGCPGFIAWLPLFSKPTYTLVQMRAACLLRSERRMNSFSYRLFSKAPLNTRLRQCVSGGEVKNGNPELFKEADINQRRNPPPCASHPGLGSEIFCPYPPLVLISMTAGAG